MKKLKLPTWLVFWFDKNDPDNFDSGYAGYGKFSKIGKKRAIADAILFSFGRVFWYYAMRFMRCLYATQSKAYVFLEEQTRMDEEWAMERPGKLPEVFYRYSLEARKHPWRLLLPVLAISLKCVIVDGQLITERIYGRQCPKPAYMRGLGK